MSRLESVSYTVWRNKLSNTDICKDVAPPLRETVHSPSQASRKTSFHTQENFCSDWSMYIDKLVLCLEAKIRLEIIEKKN